MPNNIYIGMRYVPLFDGPYNSQKVYEPLTVVEYNNSSYTSKRQVPVGILPTNTEYWARSGDFNAQYNELDGRITTAQNTANGAVTTANSALTAAEDAQDTADAAQTAADAAQDAAESLAGYKVNKKLKDSRFILVGDSYILGGREGVLNPSNGWGARMKAMLGLTDANCYIVGQDGGGFGADKPGGGYAAQLTNYAGNVANPETIDYVIGCGGQNDIPTDLLVFNTGVQSFANAVATLFPRAKCCIGMIAWDQVPSKQIQLNDVLDKYMAAINAVTGVDKPQYLAGVENSLYNMAWFGADNTHPTVEGYNSIANHVIQALGGYASTHANISGVTMTGMNGFSGTASNVGCTIANNMVHVETPTITLTSEEGVTYNANGLNNLEVASFSGLIKGETRFYRGFLGTTIVRIRDNNGTYEPLLVRYILHANRLSLIAMEYTGTGAGRQFKFTEMRVPGITIDMPMFG